MHVAVLGQLEVRVDGALVTVTGTRVRRLLARLAVDAPRAVSTAELVDAVWTGEDPPANVANALQSLVSRLRRALGTHEVVQQARTGYLLAVDHLAVDAHRFQDLSGQGARILDSNPTHARELLNEALSLWRGDPLVDADGADYALGLVGRWEQQYVDTRAHLLAARSATGESTELVGDLWELTASYPLDERFRSLLMKTLARTGRPAEALRVYEDLRSRLADELGTDPSQELQSLHLQLLRGERQPTAPAASRTNLRSPVTNFVGRDEEMKRLDSLLETSRLVTITGPGGAGKTRLATEVARSRLEREPDGVWLVELAPVTDPANVVQAFLGALDIRESYLLDQTRETAGSRDPRSRLGDALAAARCLLVVDNCEHLIDAVAALVDSLLAKCPHLQVVATSREPLGIDGEALCALASLDLPPPGVDPTSALDYAAVRLFTDRAAQVRADFTVDPETTPYVVDIVHRLDGLPLAIELAVARLRVLPVAEISARLDDRFRLLTGGSRTAMPRHRTLRAVVEWSWSLLGPEEQLLAERLAVFPAGATVEAATAVCGDERLSEDAIAALLDSLVDKSLLQISGDGQLRYRMLETLREYGVERLTERDEVRDARAHHARYFAHLVTTHAALLRGQEQLAAFRVIDAERDNALAALRFLSDSGEAQAAVDLGLALAWFWMLRSDHEEVSYWLGVALAAEGDLDKGDRTLAEAVRAATGFVRWTTEPTDPREEFRRLSAAMDHVDTAKQPWAVIIKALMALFSEDEAGMDAAFEDGLRSPDPWTRAAVLTFRAAAAENRGNVDVVRASVDEALAGFQALGDRWGTASTLAALGQLRTLDGDLDGALAAFDEAEAAMAELGARIDEGVMAMRKANLYLRLGDVGAAKQEQSRLEEAVERSGGTQELLLASALRAGLALVEQDQEGMRHSRAELQQQIQDLPPQSPVFGHGMAIGRTMMASIDIAHGDLDGAGECLQGAFDAAVQTKDLPVVASVGVVHAQLALARGQYQRAAEVLGASAALRGAEDATDVQVASITRGLREAMGSEFDTVYADGRALDRESAAARVDPGSSD